MSLTDVRTIAAKDLWVALHRRSTVVMLVLFPVLVAVGLSLVIRYAGAHAGGIPASVLPALLDSFVFFFVVGAATLPTGIAAYSLVGEKVERSLEPLLATPTSDTDILVAKAFAAWLPSVVATWLGVVLFMTLTDIETRSRLGRDYFPDTSAAFVVLAVIPMAAAASVAVSVLVSTRAVDVRTAQQVGALPALPFAAIYVLSEIGIVTLDLTTMVWISVALLVAVVGLIAAAHATFNRDDILTRWR
jgi:ABC-2 type transport system permease protein